MRYFLLIFVFAASFGQLANAEEVSAKTCTSSIEFIATLEYLRDHKEFGLDEKTSQSLAHKVSSGCSGAANRFSRGVSLLSKLEVGSKTAVEVGLKLAEKSDEYTDTFLGVFKKAYLGSHLDLDIQSSLKMASQLSYGYKGDVEVALEDFESIVGFCLGEEVNLSKGACAKLSFEVVKNNEVHKQPVAEAFFKAYRFLQGNEFLKLPVVDAIARSKNIVGVSPEAVENFIYAFKYGVSEGGLKLSANMSMDFANKLAARTVVAPVEQSSEVRLPASE